ncbi:MAG: ribonuclease R [Chitinophagaceae bacterium]|jgi:ribonuclease R|nr:ribonuclease R [Chitinophagaceae bacterium]MBK7679664.1 ribonuclease R [Chitinophagaceae bacterium]MBK8298983.1 ribonuclease R [Chitinophagaceae bacterium]MBK9464805.1 ribonuclease R [Chitinophagaceae bacterium]MBK9659835.1 ribonuclease R [Chitinophagaceae bacterium]
MGRKNAKKKKQREKPRQSSGKVLKGKLDITRSGMGFVTIEGMDVDIIIRPADFNTALHGDTVRVAIKEMKSSGRRMQGIVKEVLIRKRTEFIGHLQMNKGFAFFIAEMDKPMPDIFIPLPNMKDAKDNDRVVVKLLQWENDGKRPVGEVVTVLDAENTNDAAMKEILLEAGFPLEFPDEALEVAARIPDSISSEEIKKRNDLRSIFTITIDPVDAKDFDDAISFRKLKNGNYEIGVHIADVSHYVEPETALDKEAYHRATSVYLPDRVNPMLPEHISNVLCSLRPKEDKLTFSAIFQITPKGDVKQYWLGKTVIHSDHRFTYEEVQTIIEEKAGLHAEEILLLNELAQKFRKKRFNNGAISFSSQEVRFKLDEKGNPIGIMIKESKEAHQLIEEFMLLANRTVAENVSKIKVNGKPLPFPYRTHDDPDEEKLLPFAAFAKKFGHTFDTSSPEAIAASFNQLLKDVHGKPEQHVLEQLGIRTMAKAKYTIENVGHYGLGFEHYCHFTSPIRRYPDIQVHRILEDVLNNKINPDKKLEEKCKHTSERERAAMEAERASNKYKQVQYMKNYLGDEFEGVISGVASFGFWVETIEHKCEGLVSVNSLLEYDEFRHVETDYCLVGQRSGKKFRMGDKVKIKVVAANLTKRQLDYEWVVTGELATEKNSSEKGKKKK